MDGEEEEGGDGGGRRGNSAAPPLTQSMKQKSQQNTAVCTVRPPVFAQAQCASEHTELLCSRSDMVNESGALSCLVSIHFRNSDIGLSDISYSLNLFVSVTTECNNFIRKRLDTKSLHFHAKYNKDILKQTMMITSNNK